MERDELLRRFEPLGPVVEGPVPSYQGRGPDGQYVQVHRVAPGTEEFARLSPLVQNLRGAPPPDLVEVIDLEGGFAVVTRILPGGLSLEDWLKGARAAAPPDPDTPEPEAGDADYSAYFKIPGEGDAAGGAGGVEGKDPVPGPPVGTGASPAAPEPPPAFEPPPDLPEQPGPIREDDYTSFFQPGAPTPERLPPEPPLAPTHRPPPGPPPPPRPERPPVETAPPAQPPAPAPPPPPPRDPSSRDADSITDMFRKPAPPPPPRPDPRRERSWQPVEREYVPLRLPLDEYLRRLGGSSRSQGPGHGGGRDGNLWGGAPAPRPGGSGPPPQSAPGAVDVAPQVDRSASSMPPAAFGAGSSSPTRSRKRDLAILLGIVGFVVIIAVVIVTVLVLRGG